MRRARAQNKFIAFLRDEGRQIAVAVVTRHIKFDCSPFSSLLHPPRPSIHRCQRPPLSLPLPLFFCPPKRRHNALLSSRSFACCGCPSCPSERLRAYFSDLSAILGLISRQVTNPIATSSLPAGQPISITWQDDNKTPLLASFGPASIGLYAGNQQQQVCSPSIPFPRPLYAKSSLDSPANDCYQR